MYLGVRVQDLPVKLETITQKRFFQKSTLDHSPHRIITSSSHGLTLTRTVKTSWTLISARTQSWWVEALASSWFQCRAPLKLKTQKPPLSLMLWSLITIIKSNRRARRKRSGSILIRGGRVRVSLLRIIRIAVCPTLTRRGMMRILWGMPERIIKNRGVGLKHLVIIFIKMGGILHKRIRKLWYLNWTYPNNSRWSHRLEVLLIDTHHQGRTMLLREVA
jgi:hypothetical protein